MIIRRFLLSLFGLYALGSFAQTSAVADGSVVTLEQCREMALSNNKNLRKSAQQIKVAGYEKDQAFAAYLPAIDFAGGYMYNQKGVSVFGSDQLLPVKTFNIEKQDYEFGLVKNPGAANLCWSMASLSRNRWPICPKRL